jgi:archaellum biogenesis ATPase FlaH
MYRESLITDKTENSADLVRTTLEAIKLPEVSITLSHDREHLKALKDTVLYLCSAALEVAHDKDELLQRLKVNCAHDEKLYEALAQGLEKDMDEGSLKRTVLSIRKYLNDAFRENEIVSLISKASKELNFGRDKIKDVRQFVRDLSVKLEPYQIEASRKDPAIVGSVDIGDTSGLSEVFDEIKEMDNHTSLLKTGWQGFNRMVGGGFRRGETVTIAALPHNNKSGLSLSLFKQMAIYNTPVMINPAKKPLMLRISFEDSLLQNVQFLYQNFFENEHPEKASLKNVSAKEMAEYVKTKMQVAGYHVKMMRVNPSEWTYKDIQNTVLGLEAQGYELHVLALDYLAMLPTTGCEQGTAGKDLLDMIKRMRNFCSARKILLMTPHQLSTEAKQLMRDGHSDFVKKLVGGGYYASSRALDNEIDVEVFINIEKVGGRAYQTIQRGKHRGISSTPDKDKYFVLPFPEDGRPILDDIHGADISCAKVGGPPTGAPLAASHGAETDFWSYSS